MQAPLSALMPSLYPRTSTSATCSSLRAASRMRAEFLETKLAKASPPPEKRTWPSSLSRSSAFRVSASSW